jgi:hypothetical protein
MSDVQQQQQPGSTPPPARTPGVDDDAPEGVHRAAAGGSVTDAEEYGALDWYLGATQRPVAEVPFQFWTPKGEKKMTVKLRALDGARIQQIDTEHRNGSGPFATLDKVGFAAQLFAESAELLYDEKGNSIDLTSEEGRARYVGGAPGGMKTAVQLRFKYQEGILESLGDRVQDLSGYSTDRVGAAQRVLVDTAGNS